MRCSKAAGDDNKGLQQKDKTNITLLDKYIPYCCGYVYWIYHRWRQNVTHEPLGECVSDVLTAFWRHIILNGRTTTCNIFVLYDKEMTSSARRSSVHVSETDSTSIEALWTKLILSLNQALLPNIFFLILIIATLTCNTPEPP